VKTFKAVLLCGKILLSQTAKGVVDINDNLSVFLYLQASLTAQRVDMADKRTKDLINS
jgi:hypothetical protein